MISIYQIEKMNPEELEIYCYFRDKIFLQQLDKFAEDNYSKKRGKVKSLDNVSDAETVSRYFVNENVRYSYLIDFDKQREKVFILNNKIYTYSINTEYNSYQPITLHQWEQSDFAENLKFYYEILNLNLFQLILWRVKEIITRQGHD